MLALSSDIIDPSAINICLVNELMNSENKKLYEKNDVGRKGSFCTLIVLLLLESTGRFQSGDKELPLLTQNGVCVRVCVRVRAHAHAQTFFWGEWAKAFNGFSRGFMSAKDSALLLERMHLTICI